MTSMFPPACNSADNPDAEEERTEARSVDGEPTTRRPDDGDAAAGGPR